jgi:hypothetical protein
LNLCLLRPDRRRIANVEVKLSRTVGQTRVVDELIISFTHTLPTK